MEERFCSDFSKFQTLRVQIPAPHSWEGLGWIHFQALFQGAQPPGAGRLFLLHFICVGINNKENTENPLLEVVSEQPWISPALPLVVLIILSLPGTHNFQIWLGSPKVIESFWEAPADVGKHQGQRKETWVLKFPRLLHSQAAMI